MSGHLPTQLRAAILCAGASERLGQPKALARIGARTALDWLLESALSVDPSPIVIGGRHWPEIKDALACREDSGSNPGPVPLENPHWAGGRTSSVACAARAADGAALLVAPVDVPLVGSDVFRALAAQWARAGAPENGWLAPWTHSGSPEERRFGHPIILGAALARAIAREEDVARPLSSFRAEAAPLMGLEVHDLAIHDDLDTPEDLAQLRARVSP